MKNLLTSALLLAFSVLQAQTYVAGGIYNHTTWSPDNNPYIVTGDLVVFQDVTLTIEPGVELRFNDNTGLEVRGDIIAIGNDSSAIIFTSNNSNPNLQSWNGIKFYGTNFDKENQAIFEYCVGAYADILFDMDAAYQGPYFFRNCYFTFNFQVNEDGGSPSTFFENCTFNSNYYALDYCNAHSEAINCSFINSQRAIQGFDVVQDCYFSNNVLALGANGVVDGCTIEHNEVGVQSAFNSGAYQFTNNVVKENGIGIILESFFPEIIFSGNTFCHNELYNLELSHPNNADLPDNCWCPLDSAAVRATINDGYVNTDNGLVDFLPFATVCPEITTSTRSLEFANDVMLYPNPFSDHVNITVASDLPYSIRLYDFSGRLVHESTITSTIRLETQMLLPGIYVFELTDTDGVTSIGKLIKQQ
jgi:hypothetical protein